MKTFKPVLVLALFLAIAVTVKAQEIIEAAMTGNLAKVKELVAADPEIVNLKDENGRTPLHWACRGVHPEVLKYLVEKGADVNALDKNGIAPLHSLATRGHLEGIRFLLDNKADANIKTPNKDTPLNYAVNGGFKETIDLLLDRGADFDTTGTKALNVLQSSARTGLERMFRVAVEKGGDRVFSNGANNKQTMKDAINGGSVEIVKILLTRNIPMEKNPDIYGWTPVHYAASKDNLALLEFLVKQGIDINKRTKSGETAYNLAVACGNRKASDLIVKLGGNSKPQKFPAIKGLYMGQTPPGIKPEIFAPGIISVPDAFYTTGTFSPDGSEFYYYRWNGSKAKILFTKLVKGKWTAPDTVDFTAGYKPMEPHLTLDNKKLYFMWNHPVLKGEPGYPAEGGYYVVERTQKGWSEPKFAGQGMFMSSSLDGQIYTTDMSSVFINGKTYLAKVTVSDGLFTKYEKLTIQPFLGNQAHPCIAPDGSYILFDVGGGNHLLVSFKKKNGTWGEAIDLVDHGFDTMAGGAMISPDGKYLFFNCKRNYRWVDIKVIEALRPKE